MSILAAHRFDAFRRPNLKGRASDMKPPVYEDRTVRRDWTAPREDDAVKARRIKDAFQRLGRLMATGSDQVVYAEQDPADHIYLVVSGAVRVCRYFADGRRQIVTFHFPGDAFGLDEAGERLFWAESVSCCRLMTMKRERMIGAALADSPLAVALWEAALSELNLLREHTALLGRQTAEERVMAFLRAAALRLNSGCVLEAPMSRLDMADHLGLTIETVSRTLSQLERTGRITLDGPRRIRLATRRPARP